MYVYICILFNRLFIVDNGFCYTMLIKNELLHEIVVLIYIIM